MKLNNAVSILCSAALLLNPTLTYFTESTANNVYASELLEFHINQNGGYTVTGCSKSAENIEIPSYFNGKAVTSIGDSAFEECIYLNSVSIPDTISSIGCCAFENCISLSAIRLPSEIERIEYSVFEDCTAISSVILPEKLKYIGESAFYNCVNLSDITIPEQTETIRELAFYNCKKLSSLTIPQSVKEICSDAFTGCTGLKIVDIQADDPDFTTIFSDNPGIENMTYIRPELHYAVKQTSEPVNLKGSAQTITSDYIKLSSFTNNTAYNNGFGYNYNVDVLHEKKLETGEIYAVCNLDDTAVIFFENSIDNTISLHKEGWKFGSAVIDDDGCVYALWGKHISDDDISASMDEKNLMLCKYDKSGVFITENGISVSETRAQYPFISGNAAIDIKDDVILAVFNTLWTRNESGLHHQGSAFIAADINSLEFISQSNWQGSHSFGISMIPNSDGFAAIQLGDARNARGININLYSIINNSVSYNELNGKRLIFHASGQYGTNEKILDGNETYLHIGGLAKSSSTYAVAGKAERLYTSEVHSKSEIPDNIYDVFVRILDSSLVIKEFPEFAGENRLDGNTAETVDSNVIWLTNCDDINKVGAVKIVSLSDGSYCILWEKFLNDKFQNVRYTILDQFGNTIRPESVIENVRLSDNSTQPTVNDFSLKWAVTDGEAHSLTWYTVDLSADEQLSAVTTTTSTSTVSFSTTTTIAVENFILGDVNFDSHIDALDASLVLSEYARISTGHENSFSDKQIIAANVNNDGKVDAMDASLILTFYTYSSVYSGISLEAFLKETQ